MPGLVTAPTAGQTEERQREGGEIGEGGRDRAVLKRRERENMTKRMEGGRREERQGVRDKERR